MTNAPPPPSTAAQSARTILTRLHEVMASRVNAQGKLNQVVGIIGECLDSEVCSIYLLRDGALELYATRGLKQEAVHVTRLGLGEGLVGTIAEQIETLNLDEAAAHPDFSYRPETGEELFHSFAGVPIIRRERAVGVLCVQHAGKAVEQFLAGFGAIGKVGVRCGFVEVQRLDLVGDHPDQPLAKAQAGDVHRFLLQPARCIKFERAVAQQID